MVVVKVSLNLIERTVVEVDVLRGWKGHRDGAESSGLREFELALRL